MMSSSESHLRIDYNIIFSLWVVMMEGAVYHAAVFYHDRLEKILFPFLVPVFVFRFGNGISNLGVGYRKVCQCFFQGIFIEQALLYISLNASLKLSKPISPASADRTSVTISLHGCAVKVTSKYFIYRDIRLFTQR